MAGNAKSYHSAEKQYQLKRLKSKNLYLRNENSLTYMSCSRTKRIWNSPSYGAHGDNFVSKRLFHSPTRSKIVFNGTFPIDRPFQIRDNLCTMKLQVLAIENIYDRLSTLVNFHFLLSFCYLVLVFSSLGTKIPFKIVRPRVKHQHQPVPKMIKMAIKDHGWAG